MNPHDLAPCPECGDAVTEHEVTTEHRRQEGAHPWWEYECAGCGWAILDMEARWTWGAAAEASPLVKLLLADLAASRETNARLHRRVQQAESNREALAIAAGMPHFAGQPHANDLRFAIRAWWDLKLRIAPHPTPISELPRRALAVLSEVEQLRAEVAALRNPEPIEAP